MLILLVVFIHSLSIYIYRTHIYRNNKPYHLSLAQVYSNLGTLKLGTRNKQKAICGFVIPG